MYIKKRPILLLVSLFITVLSIMFVETQFPQEHSSLDYVYLMLLIIELVIIGFSIYKFRLIVQKFREERQRTIYLPQRLDSALKEVMSNNLLRSLVVSEVSFIYFSIIGWFKEFKTVHQSDQVFTYHMKSNYKAFFWAFLVAVLVETLAVHFIIGIWSEYAAWIVTALTLYFVVYMLGDYNAAKLQPIVIRDAKMYFRVALRWQATIDVTMIQDIKVVGHTTSILDEKKAEDALSLVLLNESNIEMQFNDAVPFRGLFGFVKRSRKIRFFVDDSDALVATLKNRGVPQR